MAKALFRQSLDMGLPAWWSHALPTLGWTLISLDELAEADHYFQKVLTEAEAQGRHPVSLDAQVGLAYVEGLRLRSNSPDRLAWLAKCRSVLQTVYHHPATAAETRQRIGEIAPMFEWSL